MAQLIVRNIEEGVKARLKQRAGRHGASLEEEVRSILRNAVTEDRHGKTRLGSRIQARFAKVGLSVELPELRGQAPRSADFKP